MLIADPLFRTKVVSFTPNPQQAVWVAMHQDYSEDMAMGDRGDLPTENAAGNIIVKRLLAGGRGHYGPLEHPQIVFNVGYFPHSVVQQIRTHRIGCSFDVSSLRYTGQRILAAANGDRAIKDVFYVRPVGHYSDRQGKSYFYSEDQRLADLEWCRRGAERYAQRIAEGLSEEHARGLIPFDVRQHFVMSCNARSLMHILDLRAKADAQPEIQTLSHLLMQHFRWWMPAIAEWYESHRLHKAKLSP
jgi:thymidylate synthase (FAD)